MTDLPPDSNAFTMNCVGHINHAFERVRAIAQPLLMVSDKGTKLTSVAILALVPRSRGRRALYRARQADTERLHRKLQRPAARRMPERRSCHGSGGLFRSLAHARTVLAAWRDDYNHVRPHGALGGLTPVEAATLARIIHNNHNAGLQT